MKIQLLLLAISFCYVSGYGGAVDSVTVDSVWNSDSSLYENGLLQQRSARDCLISFFPRGTGIVYCSLTVSLDSGKSWNPIPDPLRILGGKQNDAFQCGVKGQIKARIFGGDQPGVAFKIIANTCNVRNPQSAFSSLKFGAIMSYNMSTYDRCCCSDCYSVTGEWGRSNRDPKIFKPKSSHCGQWADAAKSAGCNYMVLTVKHHDGFCLWPTKQTEYCVRNAACTTNIVKEFVDSARNRGMKVGLSYSIRDLTNGYSLSFIKAQLTELLSDYGDLTGLWFDGWG